MAPDHLHAVFVARPNRFLVIAELPSGEAVEAYLPNTGRLEHLTRPGNRLILRRETGHGRRTRYTATRAWDGCWVALEAARAPALLAGWLETGNPLPGLGIAGTVEREVKLDRHRLDLRIRLRSGPVVWVEVKSGGRAVDGTGLLSRTPSGRGVAHLAVLAELAASGRSAAVAFVIQRADVRELLIGGDADPGWIEAVRAAGRAGVTVLAFGCEVTETTVAVARPLPVRVDE